MSTNPLRLILVVVLTVVVTTTVVLVVRHNDNAKEAADKRLTEWHPVEETRDQNDTLQLLDRALPDQAPPNNN